MKVSGAVSSFVAVCCAASGTLQAEPADTVFSTAISTRSTTGSPTRKRSRSKAAGLFSSAQMRRREEISGASARASIDLQGQTVVPGLTDSHCHIFGIGEREMNLNLEGTNTLEDFLAKVKERVATNRARQMGHRPRLDRDVLEAAAIPHPRRSRQDRAGQSGLSRPAPMATPRSPTARRSRSPGSTRDTPNPFGGEILRDKQTGEPTGMLLDNAQDLVAKHIPHTDRGRTRAGTSCSG